MLLCVGRRQLFSNHLIKLVQRPGFRHEPGPAGSPGDHESWFADIRMSLGGPFECSGQSSSSEPFISTVGPSVRSFIDREYNSPELHSSDDAQLTRPLNMVEGHRDIR